MAETHANQRRQQRQDELRELLSGKGLIQQALATIEKIESCAEETDVALSRMKVEALVAANEQRMKLLDKILPTLKVQEVTGEGGGPLMGKWLVEVVRSNAQAPAP